MPERTTQIARAASEKDASFRHITTCMIDVYDRSTRDEILVTRGDSAPTLGNLFVICRAFSGKAPVATGCEDGKWKTGVLGKQIFLRPVAKCASSHRKPAVGIARSTPSINSKV